MINTKEFLKRNAYRTLSCVVLSFAMLVTSGDFSAVTAYAAEMETESPQTTEADEMSETGDAHTENGAVSVYEEPETIAEPVASETTAAVTAIGTINAINVKVRQTAGTSGTELCALDRGHTVDVIGQTTVNGAIWYQVICTKNGTQYTGWTHGRYIDLVYTNVETDEAFVQGLRDAGFPESYIPYLSALHAKYPNWTFLPVHTGLDWNAVIEAESKAAVNMVQTSADDAKKSVASSEYNWFANTWTIRDGTGWVTAHPDYIAYCMDPRNYLTETSIFQYESLSFSSAHNLAGVQAVLSNTFMAADALEPDGSTLNYANTFMSIGQQTNVSPYHLASRVAQEQGNGTSPIISGTYEGYAGYFNYFNINATGTPVSALYANGLSYAQKQGWDTRYKSLLGGAGFIGEKYIAKGQDTLYFQKFNVVYQDQLYRHQYMANVTAAITEGQKIAIAYSDKTQSFVFKIPVYLNMPESAVTFTASGNRNNYLSGLSISGLSLTPTFNAATTEYSVIVDGAVNSVSVAATSVFSKARIKGTGAYNLTTGTNLIQVDCISESGDTRTYNITVVKTDSSNTNYNITSSTYTVGNYITGIAPGTTVSDFLANISCAEGVVKVITASGEENTGNIATGNKLAVYINDVLVGTKDIVIYGDVNGDGQVSVLDIIKINRNILALDQLSGAYQEAGDANRKGDGITILDLIVVNRHSLGLTTIQQ